ncbi:MAG: recombination protein RecR [Pseudomonadota bacterium]|jgi:recombination protein RecR
MAEPTLEGLIEALRRLPGVGPRSAQRMAWHLLQHDRPAVTVLAQALTASAQRIGHCERCHTFTEHALCATCADASRDPRQLCVIESPSDQAVLERTGSFKGLYFVLLGRISPMDGVGPEAIGLTKLLDRVHDGQVQEVIVATGFTAEGEATAHAITAALKPHGVKVTRLARGVPAGSEIEYVDLGTIAHALMDRR